MFIIKSLRYILFEYLISIILRSRKGRHLYRAEQAYYQMRNWTIHEGEAQHATSHHQELKSFKPFGMDCDSAAKWVASVPDEARPDRGPTPADNGRGRANSKPRSITPRDA